MAYTPTEWNTGDTITASALNKIEGGIANAGAAMLVHVDYINNEWIMDTSFIEIYSALEAGTPCYMVYANLQGDDPDQTYTYRAECAPIIAVTKYNLYYRVYASIALDITVSGEALGAPALKVFSVSQADEYPVYLKTVYVKGDSLTVHSVFS